jgi:hypothetical protein
VPPRLSSLVVVTRRAGLEYAVLVELAARRFTIPFECPCCGAAPDTELPIHLERTSDRRVASESARALVFPYCQRCADHVTGWEAAAGVPAGAMLAALIVAIVLAIAVHVVAGVVLLAIAAPGAYVLYRMRRAAAKTTMGPSCASPGRALAYLGWSGAESGFEVESHTYAARLAEQNEGLVANPSPQLVRLLEGHRIARLAVPTPAAAIHAVPPPATLADWIARIEAARGTVARRSTLKRALDGLHDPGERQDAIAAAARLELAPILEEVEGMSSVAAKGRLGRAIDAIRADNIPEELQAAVLRELDARWRRLG